MNLFQGILFFLVIMFAFPVSLWLGIKLEESINIYFTGDDDTLFAGWLGTIFILGVIFSIITYLGY